MGSSPPSQASRVDHGPHPAPWQLLLLIWAALINRDQTEALEFYRLEVEVLQEKLGKKRLLLNDDQRRRLAVKGRALGRKALRELTTIVTSDTILRWHRELVAKKWDYSARQRKKPGRPPTPEEIAQLVVEMARENPSWGYDRIVGALANLGRQISDQTVGNILKAHGLEPAPQRKHKSTWKTFIQSHWDVLGAIDFTTIEVWSKGGLVTFYLLFVMDLATRRAHFAGCTPNPDGPWMQQIARNLTDAEDGFLKGKRYVLLDRDGKFSPAFQKILETEGVEPVPLPPKNPNLNAQLERFHRWPSLRPRSVVLKQGPVQLRSHGNQSRLAELRVPNGQDRPVQVHVGPSQMCRFVQTQAGSIVHQNHRSDRRWLQDTFAPWGLDHFEKAAEFFPRVNVGNECRWLLRHYGRKRGSGDITTAQSILEEAPQAAQLEEPCRGHSPTEPLGQIGCALSIEPVPVDDMRTATDLLGIMADGFGGGEAEAPTADSRKGFAGGPGHGAVEVTLGHESLIRWGGWEIAPNRGRSAAARQQRRTREEHWAPQAERHHCRAGRSAAGRWPTHPLEAWLARCQRSYNGVVASMS